MLDWIFEGIVGWVASIVSQAMDAVSALFLEALGTDMTAMEEYFPFITKAFDVIQITAWAILILITVWQLFRAFGGPITEAENPWHLLIRGAMFALSLDMRLHRTTKGRCCLFLLTKHHHWQCTGPSLKQSLLRTRHSLQAAVAGTLPCDTRT